MIGKKDGKIVQAFTIKYKGKARELITSAGVSIPINEDSINRHDKRILNVNALWDTGATSCVITESVAKKLNLKPISVAKVGGLGGFKNSNVYLVHLYLADNIIIQNITVSEIEDLNGKFGIIFGMNLINQGDFSITNSGDNTTFSIQWPSLETIDYEKGLSPISQNQISSKKVIGDKIKDAIVPDNTPRNRPCPCGSGRKYKHCHGKK